MHFAKRQAINNYKQLSGFVNCGSENGQAIAFCLEFGLPIKCGLTVTTKQSNAGVI